MYKEDKKASEAFEKDLQGIFGSQSVTYMKGKIEEIQEPDKKQKMDIITGKEIIAEPKVAENEDDKEHTETDIENVEKPENEEDADFSEEEEPDREETDVEPEIEEPEIMEQENQEPEDTQEEEPEEEEPEDEED